MARFFDGEKIHASAGVALGFGSELRKIALRVVDAWRSSRGYALGYCGNRPRYHLMVIKRARPPP